MNSFDFGNCRYGNAEKPQKNRYNKKDPTIV